MTKVSTIEELLIHLEKSFDHINIDGIGEWVYDERIIPCYQVVVAISIYKVGKFNLTLNVIDYNPERRQMIQLITSCRTVGGNLRAQWTPVCEDNMEKVISRAIASKEWRAIYSKLYTEMWYDYYDDFEYQNKKEQLLKQVEEKVKLITSQ